MFPLPSCPVLQTSEFSGALYQNSLLWLEPTIPFSSLHLDLWGQAELSFQLWNSADLKQSRRAVITVFSPPLLCQLPMPLLLCSLHLSHPFLFAVPAPASFLPAHPHPQKNKATPWVSPQGFHLSQAKPSLRHFTTSITCAERLLCMTNTTGYFTSFISFNSHHHLVQVLCSPWYTQET